MGSTGSASSGADRVRVAVVGLGWPGLRHLEGYLKNPHAEVVALVDASQPLLSLNQRQYGIERGFASLAELLDWGGCDAVSICTPNHLHAPMSIAALEAGQHVLCEKPLATTLAEGAAIVEKARASDRVFMMGFCRRYREDSKAVKRLVEAGELGEVYYARAGWLRREWNPTVRNWFLRKAQSGGGPLIDLGVHMLDLALWLMGDPEPVAVSGAVYNKLGPALARSAEMDVEDMASAYVRLNTGATLTLETSWVSYTEARDHVFCQLLGTKGGAKIELGLRPEGEHVEAYTSRAGVPVTERVFFGRTTEFTRSSFDNETAEFISAIREGREPTSTVEHGYRILRILDAIYRSAEAGAEIKVE